jgi:hypothetical protein
MESGNFPLCGGTSGCIAITFHNIVLLELFSCYTNAFTAKIFSSQINRRTSSFGLMPIQMNKKNAERSINKKHY